MNEQKAIQGGPTAIRGYLVQTLVALLKIAQSNPPFLEITLEPSHANEQFDFISQNQHGSDAVQVKSTINTFQKSEVEGWAKKLESERKNETCTLVLVGNYHTNLARINNIGAVRIEKKNLDIQGLIGEAAHLVAKFIESQKLYAGTADEREMITHSVISRLLQYSTTSETLKRETFIKLLAGWIRDAPSKIRLHGKQSNEIRNNLSSEWLRSGPPVAILQGLPGSGKTLLALAIAENAKRALDTIEPTVDTEDPSTDTLISLASAFSGVGISDLMQEVEKGRDGQPFKVLLKLLRNEDILIVIDEFQRLFFKGKTIPSIDWQKLVEQLNSSNRPNGRLMLISNRAVKTERWCERCVIREVKPLSDTEAGSYLCEQLEEKGVTSKVPPERLQEIGGRMGGNPRAIATLAESLTFDSLEDLLSMSPAIFTTGDVEINHALVEDFERGLIERTLSRIEKDLLHSLRQLSVHRRPF
ncbi:MAG: ATP-binding protein, partial [Hydrogenophaga sp.]|nr:ATP-binding protein [Hydrogenophaga sp.]